jgi:hypothetical protein
VANLGDVSFFVREDPSMHRARGPFTTSKQPTSVVVDITDAPDGSLIALTTRGKQVDYARGSTTEPEFFDLDDGDYLAYVAFDGSPGLAWSINVTGTVVTITRISTSGIVANWHF